MTARPEDRCVRTWRPNEDVAALRAQFREPMAGVQGAPVVRDEGHINPGYSVVHSQSWRPRLWRSPCRCRQTP